MWVNFLHFIARFWKKLPFVWKSADFCEDWWNAFKNLCYGLKKISKAIGSDTNGFGRKQRDRLDSESSDSEEHMEVEMEADQIRRMINREGLPLAENSSGSAGNGKEKGDAEMEQNRKMEIGESSASEIVSKEIAAVEPKSMVANQGDVDDMDRKRQRIKEFIDKSLYLLMDDFYCVEQVLSIANPTITLHIPDRQPNRIGLEFPDYFKEFTEFVSVTSAENFLRALSEVELKNQWPCFYRGHRSDFELKKILENWELAKVRSLTWDSVTDVSTKKSTQKILAEATEMVQKIVKEEKPFSFMDPDLLLEFNRVADGMCLSILSIMNVVVDAILEKFPKPLEKSSVRGTKRPFLDAKKAKDKTKVDGENKDEEDGEPKPKQLKTAEEEEVTVLALGSYEQLAEAPPSHNFVGTDFKSALNKKFTTAVYRDMKLLKNALPNGIFVKSYENRYGIFRNLLSLYTDLIF